MKAIINKPQIEQLSCGEAVKVLQVTGESDALMPKHYSTKEAVITMIEGSVLLEINGKEQLLMFPNSILIPAKKSHSLLIMTKMKALVIMPADSSIKFLK